MDILQTVKTKLNQPGLIISDLSRKTGISERTLYRLKNGEDVIPKYSTVYRLYNYLK